MNLLNRRKFIKAATGATVGLLLTPLMAKSKRKPNIIFLFTDDQAYHLLGHEGHPNVKSPNFDKLAADGTVFGNNYNTTSICMASRANVMTGLYEYRTGCNFTRGAVDIPTWKKSYPVLLRETGYRTCFAGKFGFPVSKEKSDGWKSMKKIPFEDFDVWHGWGGQGVYKTAENKEANLQKYAEEYPHTTLALAAAGNDFIEESVEMKKLFCLSISYKAPHKPLKPDPRFDDVYKDTVWEELENYDLKGAAHIPEQAKSGRQFLKIDNFRPGKYQAEMRKYNQLVYGIDYALGMLREKLEKLGIADNTVIITTSDNGYNCGAHGFGGKVLPYEEGSKAPLIIYDPRLSKKYRGKRSEAVTGNIDMMPTILEYAGVEVPKDIDGISLVDLVKKPKDRVRDAMPIMNVWGSIPTHEMGIVTEEFKYINWFYGVDMEPAEELYNHKDDKYEMHNLLDDEKHHETLQKMRAYYDKEIQRWHDKCVQRNNYPLWGQLLDRSIPWEEKKKLVPEKLIRKSKEEIKNAKINKKNRGRL